MEVISSIYNSGYNIKKFYLGSRELNLAYLGNQVIYDEVIGDNDLNYILYEFYGSDTLPNTVEAPVKSATLKGSTKYRDIDTGDILDTFDETKNLELVSVKVPVLKTSNINQWDGKKISDLETDYIEIYNCQFSTNAYDGRVTEYDENFNVVTNKYIVGLSNKMVTTKSNNCKYIRIESNLFKVTDQFYVEGGLVVSSFVTIPIGMKYEPHKSNILTVNEPIELRGIGEGSERVKDELDLLTGKLIKRTGTFTLNGSESFSWHGIRETTAYGFNISKDEIMKKLGESTSIRPPYAICNILPSLGYTCHGNGNEGFAVNSDFYAHIQINISLNKLTESSENGLRQYLQANPLTFVVVLEQEVDKTVDLTIVDQDGKTINKLNSFNGTTHVSTDVAENSAYPMVSLEVASELQAAMSKVTEDIELIKPVQNDIETTIDTQSNDIDSLLLATTELFEMFL